MNEMITDDNTPHLPRSREKIRPKTLGRPWPPLEQDGVPIEHQSMTTHRIKGNGV